MLRFAKFTKLMHRFPPPLQLLVQRQESEQELNQKVQKLQGDRTALSDRVAALQRQLANMETEQKEASRNARGLEKDKTALKKTLDKV